MYLIQIFLPIYDNTGAPFSKVKFNSVKKDLTEKFGGLTSFIRSPAEGFWKDDENEIVKDDVILLEVMDEQVDLRWWKQYKNTLEEKFEQDEIIIRSTQVDLL